MKVIVKPQDVSAWSAGANLPANDYCIRVILVIVIWSSRESLSEKTSMAFNLKSLIHN